MMAPSPPPRSEGSIPPARGKAPAINGWIEDCHAKEAGGGFGEMMEPVAGLRQELKDREEMGKTRVAEAKGRLTSANERAAVLLEDLFRQEFKEEERFEMWRHVTEDAQEMNARRHRGEAAYPHRQSPQALPGDGWGGMTESLDPEMARITSLVDAAGPSPSSVVSEFEARQADLETEEGCSPSHELERKIQELVASEWCDGLEEGVGGSATTTTTNINTNTNEHSNTSNNEQSTAATSSPSVSGLREEKRYLYKRVEMYNGLTEQLLRYIDGRQTAADEHIHRMEEALVACDARRKVLRVAIKGALKEMAETSARVKELQLAQVESHIPPENSITEEIADWEEEEFYYAFIEHVREAGGDSEEKDVFIAEEILSEEKNWYVRRQLLGEGGFGRVDKVSAFTPREYFALKTLKTDMGEGSVEDSSLLKIPRESLMAEMAVHCRLPPHENIAKVKAMDDRHPAKLQILYELGESDFTKYSWGATRTSLCELMGHLVGVTAGLMFLHEHDIGHNDLKPENILLFKGKPGTDYTVKLADLGLALAFGDLRKGHGSLGITPPEAIVEKYMPCRPDQDVFAVGHLILLIVTKRRYKNYNMFLSRAVAPKNFDLQIMKLDFEGKCRLMEKKTLRRMVSPDYRRKLFNPTHISDKLGDLKDEVLEMVDLMTSVDPSRRPSMKTVETFVVRIHQCLLEDRALSAAGPQPTVAAEGGGVDSEQSETPARSTLNGSNAVSTDIPSMEVLLAKEMGGASNGGGGSTGGPSVPVVAQANGEEDIRQSEVGTVAGETARLPEAIIDGAATAASADAATLAVAAADTATFAVAAAAAVAAASATRNTNDGGCSDVGCLGGPSAPVVSPANIEGGLRQSELETVAGETARLPEAIIDGAAAPASAGVATPAATAVISPAAPPAAASAATSVPAPTAPVAAAPAAAAAAAGATCEPCDGIGGGGGHSAPVAAAPAAAAAAAAGATCEPCDGIGGGGGGGHSAGDGAAGASSLTNVPTATTCATVAQEILTCVSVEEFAVNGERERQAPAPGPDGSRCAMSSRVPSAKAATEETGVVLPSRVGYVPDVCGSESCTTSRLATGAPVQAFQATTAVTRRAAVTVPSAVDGGGAVREAPCEGARRPARRTAEHNRKRGKEAEWLLQDICKGKNSALPQKVAGAVAGGGGNAAEHDRKRGKGAEWLLQDICKGNPAALPQKVAGAMAGGGAGGGGGGGGGGVHYVASSRVNARKIKTSPQVAASPAPSGSHGGFNIAHIVRAAVTRFAPPPRRDGGGAAAPPFIPGPQAPPPSQAVLGWAGWGVFSRYDDVGSTRRRAVGGLDGGHRVSAGRVVGGPATRAKARQLAGAWQAGAAHGPSYGGLAPHAHVPCGGYGGWAAPKQQWVLVACGAPGYHP